MVSASDALHQLATHIDGGVLRYGADPVARAALAGRAQKLAAEILGITGDAGGMGMRIGLRHNAYLEPSALATGCACA